MSDEGKKKQKPWITATARSDTESYRNKRRGISTEHLAKVVGSTNVPAEMDKAMHQALKTLDSNYVPGYSEYIIYNDLAPKYGLARKEPPARLQWMRGKRVDGSDNFQGISRWRRQGVDVSSKEDLEACGYDMPLAAHESQDGTIWKDDVVLGIEPQESALERREEKQARARAMTDAPRSNNPQLWEETEERKKIQVAPQQENYEK